MDVKAKLIERKKMVDDVYAFKSDCPIPLFSNVFTWKFLDAGYKLDEVMYDYDKIESIMDEFDRTYQYDIYGDLGNRNLLRVNRAIGGGIHRIDEAGESIYATDHDSPLVEDDEFREFREHMMETNWLKVFPRIARPGITLGELREGVYEFCEYNKFFAKMERKCNEEYGALIATVPGGTFEPPIEWIFGSLRGIKLTSMDLRRNKAELKETVDMMWNMLVKPNLNTVLDLDTSGYMCDFYTGMLCQNFLNQKQFDEFYWSYMKQAMDLALANHKHYYIFAEGTILRLADYFDDTPKGSMLIHLEQDNIFEMRERLPQIALAGGMPTKLLAHGTEAECIDYAKKLIEELGDGFIMSQEKMISYRNDAKRENLLAVNEFVRNYR